jgi:PiT family inorganic phosphate transporter
MTSSISGMPISGTHTVVGALIGAGIIATGASNVNWEQLFSIALSWVVSPLVSGIVSFMFMMMVAALTMNTATLSYRFRLLAQ